MKSQPLVTIYVPCRNYGRYLEQAVESVFSQVYCNWELIIIDEGSSDSTIPIAEKLVSKYPSKVSLIKNSTPMGLQKLANHVLSIANGKYMMRLDADDWLDEAAVFLMVNRLESSDNAGMVYGNYYYTDPKGKVIDVEFRHKLGAEDLAGHLPPHGACTLFSTRSLKVVGGYSEDIDAQDGWDLWFKLVDRIGAISIQTPVFYYRQHGKSLSRDNKRLLNARSKIFADIASKLEGDYQPSIAAVIPVRESYPNFEGVPYQDINGRSILELAIISAAKSNRISTIIVSSESQRVLDYSKKLESDGKVPEHQRLLRKTSDTSDGIPIRDFMFIAGEGHAEIHNSFPDIVIYLSLHAINRTEDHIDNALNVLRITESDSVVSVQEEREPMFHHGKHGLDLINPGRFQDLTFDKERLYRFNGSLIATWWESLKLHSLFGEKTSYIEMSREDSLQIKSKQSLNLLKANEMQTLL